MIASILERELERGEQSFRFCIGLRGRGDADVHTPESIDLVVLDFRENDLLFNAHVVVTLAVETLAGDTAEVTDTRQGHGHQTIQELEHTGATQGDHAANRITVTNLEASNGLAGLGRHRLLTCDLLHVANGVFKNLLSATASPTPMFRVILVIRGTSMTDL